MEAQVDHLHTHQVSRGRVAPTTSRRFRLGLWCDYSILSLAPNLDGVGVFLANLIEGLLSQSEQIEICVLVRPGEAHLFESLVAKYPGRISVIPQSEPAKSARQREWLSSHYWDRRATEFLLALPQKEEAIRLAKVRWREFACATHHGKRRSSPLLAAGAKAFKLPASLAIGALAKIRRHHLQVKAAIAKGVIRCAAAFTNRVVIEPTPNQLAASAKCDLWVLPHGVLPTPVKVPAIAFVHDVVTEHFAHCFDAHIVDRVKQLITRRCEEAALVCCMSEFIRSTDLVGLLEIERERTRMVPVVSPAPFALTPSDDSHSRLLPELKGRKFLFWPAGLRAYKGHIQLLKAVAHLRDNHHIQDFDVVFTGNRLDSGRIQEAVEQLCLADRVHVLGPISREDLGVYYQYATATVVPTQYEQASFPVFEALQSRCPVACADIPPLREQCASLGDAMIYMDPLNPASIAEAIQTLLANPSQIAERQWNASKALRSRNWQHSSAEWLDIFKEGARIAAAGPRKVRQQVMFIIPCVLPPELAAEVYQRIRSIVLEDRQKRRYDFVLGVHPDQADTRATEQALPELRVVRILPQRITQASLRNTFGKQLAQTAGHSQFIFFKGTNGILLESDAWIVISDAPSSIPLAPLRPYGVVSTRNDLTAENNSGYPHAGFRIRLNDLSQEIVHQLLGQVSRQDSPANALSAA